MDQFSGLLGENRGSDREHAEAPPSLLQRLDHLRDDLRRAIRDEPGLLGGGLPLEQTVKRAASHHMFDAGPHSSGRGPLTYAVWEDTGSVCALLTYEELVDGQYGWCVYVCRDRVTAAIT